MSGCFRPSSLLTVSAGRAKSHNGTWLPLRFFFCLFSILQLKTVLLVHVRERSTDGQKYFIEQSFFFKIMSFKCVNLYVKQTFSRTSACGRSDTDFLVWERDRTLTEELNRLAQSCWVVLCVQEGIHCSGHHNASNLSWKPATILSFCYACRICTLWWVFKIACFLRNRVFTNVCKIGPRLK